MSRIVGKVRGHIVDIWRTTGVEHFSEMDGPGASERWLQQKGQRGGLSKIKIREATLMTLKFVYLLGCFSSVFPSLRDTVTSIK